MTDLEQNDHMPPSRYDRVLVGIAIALGIGGLLLLVILASPRDQYDIGRPLAMFGLGLLQLPIVGTVTILAFVKGMRNLGAGLIIGGCLVFLLGPAACFGYVARVPVRWF